MAHRTKQRARQAAVFIAAAFLGASAAAHATPQCRRYTKLALSLTSVTVDGKAQAFRADDLSLYIGNSGPVAGGGDSFFAQLYDPDTKAAREVSLEER